MEIKRDSFESVMWILSSDFIFYVILDEKK